MRSVFIADHGCQINGHLIPEIKNSGSILLVTPFPFRDPIIFVHITRNMSREDRTSEHNGNTCSDMLVILQAVVRNYVSLARFPF